MRSKQTGTSLVIVVILLVILMISALALVRSSETVGAVAGNVAFKQAATAAAEPLLEPDVPKPRFQGLRAGPYSGWTSP